MNTQSPALKIIPIGGTTTVQKNMYVYECGNDIVVFDCGIGFPDAETPGVDVIIPDFTYILENRDKVRGIVITHGHEDHRSALPYLMQEHKFPIYAMPFVKGLIEKALEEYTNMDGVHITPIDPNVSFQLGVFRIHPFRVNHSIPDTLGFAIDTPQGRVFHDTDFKFDWSPVMDKPFDVQKAAKLAGEPQGGVLALLSDCLGSTHDGYAESEKFIENEFDKILQDSKGRQVFITTISSNISRINQAINSSIKCGRKVVVSGRSLRNTISVAREFGYIKHHESSFVNEKIAFKMNQADLTYIITGCYGQKEAGLFRLALGEHNQISLQENAVVIFSADPIPNSVSMVNVLIDELYKQNVEVYYSEIQDNLHVSGHGSRGDLSLLAHIVRPRFFIPIGGNIKHMRAYADMLVSQGEKYENIFQLLDGQEIVFNNGKASLGKRLKLKEVYVDGNLIGDVGTTVIHERLHMADHGIVVAVVRGDTVEIVTRGFIFVKESGDLLNQAKALVRKRINGKVPAEQKEQLQAKIEGDLQKFFLDETGREPIITVLIG